MKKKDFKFYLQEKLKLSESAAKAVVWQVFSVPVVERDELINNILLKKFKPEKRNIIIYLSVACHKKAAYGFNAEAEELEAVIEKLEKK